MLDTTILNAQIHQLIVSGEFRAWRKRTRILETETRYAANGRRLEPCTHPGCKEYYQVTPHKPNTFCAKHAILHRERAKRTYHMAPCASSGCNRMIYVVRNRTGMCAAHSKKQNRTVSKHK